jgi:hypothetical protein
VLFTVGVRVSVQEQVGGAGVSRVTAAFEVINWGTAENPRHDLGTDLFVMARDERRYDLGLVVGVQVKTGPKYFRRPSKKDGVEIGWWFHDNDRSHVDAWLSHVLPHLIVLHNLESGASYWAHVTPEAVQPTGKGAKILVLKENTLDAAHRDALLQVAASTRSGLPLEGSVWTGVASLLPKDRLRHALICTTGSSATAVERRPGEHGSRSHRHGFVTNRAGSGLRLADTWLSFPPAKPPVTRLPNTYNDITRCPPLFKGITATEA